MLGLPVEAQVQAQSTATVRGVVLDATTHQPIARVLVSLGQAGSQLTDSFGDFVFDQVTLGSSGISFRRPGYASPLGPGTGEQTVLVASDMPPLTLLLAPLATLSGQVQVPDGDSPAGVRLVLFRAGSDGGWRHWLRSGATTTQPNGSFLFPGLRPGSYAVYAQPSLDPVPYGTPPGTRSGYAPVFSPNAQDLSLATVYTLAAGQTAVATLQLSRVPFYPVTAQLAGDDIPSASITGDGFMAWRLRGRPGDGLRADLPSGAYTLNMGGDFRQVYAGTPPLMASVAFAVHAGPALIANITPVRQPPVTLNIQRVSPPGGEATASSQPFITLQFVPVGDPTGPVLGLSTAGNQDEPPSMTLPPGRYQVAASASGGYLSALTSGGADLLTQPLTIAPGAATEITARVGSDIGTLTVTLTGDVATSCVVYAIPLAPGQDERVESSTTGTLTLSNLAPGDYIVFATAERVSIPFREPGVLQQLSGQRVTVAPGGEAQAMLRGLSILPAGLMDAQ